MTLGSLLSAFVAGDPFDPFAVPRTGGGSNRNFIDDGRSIRELTPDFVLCTIIDVVYGRADLPMTIASDTRRPASLRSFWLGMAAYLAPTFPIAFIWHLVLFEPNYHALQIYRADPIIPFGLASMIIQAIVFSWVFPRAFAGSSGSVLKNGLLYGLGAGLLSWSFTTLAVAAKHPMASITDYVLLETAFTVLQFLIVGPLIALAYRN